MLRSVALVGGLLLVAACMPDRHTDSSDDRLPAQPPFVFESLSSQVEVQLSMDPTINHYPALSSRLTTEGTAALRTFEQTSLVDRVDGEMTGLAPFRMSISWVPGGTSPRLASFDGFESTYAGGAHPDGRDMSIFWDRTLGREIDPRLIFKPGAESRLDTLLCSRLNAEKRRRDPYFRTIPMTEADGFYCPASKDVPFILAPASRGEKAAGIIYLMGPYVGGAYSEGTFRIFLPTSSLRLLLSDAYLDQFSDNPRQPETSR